MTEKQQKFLEVLFEEAGGDFVRAKKLAGYSNNVAVSQIVEPLQKEIQELTWKYLQRSSVKAAIKMQSMLDDPTQLGGKDMMTAAKDVLDRSGFNKVEKVEVEAKSPIFILPAKSDETD